MRLLLDTQMLLWSVADSGRLPCLARTLLEDVGNEVYFSAASQWEIAIKSALRRDDFTVDPVDFLASLASTGYVELPVSARHATHTAFLPPLHKDPFDRLLLAQAMLEPMTLLSNDRQLAAYWSGVMLA